MTSLEAVPTTGSIDRVVLEVPATTSHLRTIRLLVSALATSHGADLNDLEDLRIASGELCAHLINEAPDDARMTLVAEVFASEGAASPWLRLRANIPGSDSVPDFDEISSMVLSAAADSFGVGEPEEGSAGSVSERSVEISSGSTAAAWFSRTVRYAVSG